MLSNTFGQTFTDIAANQGVSLNYTATDLSGVGMSFYDFNEDGWDDLTFPSNSGEIVFYVNNNGAFVQAEWNIQSIGVVRELLWVDYDNDGDLDLGISYKDLGFRLYQNDGSFNFTDVTANAGIITAPFNAYGFAFADPDKDGDLDFYLTSHEVPGQVASPESNFYYVNQGNGTFIEQGQALGIDNGQQPTFMPVWFDYNNDTHLDLALINDKSLWNDALYVNDGLGNFTESAATVGISNNGHNPMSLSVADYNNDGYQDIFKSDIGSDYFEQGVELDHKLYRNNFGIDFTNVAPLVGLDTNVFSWGGLWVDYNNDCFEDLFIATTLGGGHESLLYRNNGGQAFELMNDSLFGNTLHTSYCPVKGDIDNDGFYDVVLLNDLADPNVFLNSGNSNNYIKLDLVGTISNQKAIGATIEVYANGQHQSQVVFCGSAMCAQNSQHNIIGVGPATIVDSVVVSFPSGIVCRKLALAVNAHYTIVEQIQSPVVLNGGVDTVYACVGDTVEMGIPGFANYQWNTGNQDSIVQVVSSGYYSFEAMNQTLDTVFISNAVYVDFEFAPSIISFVNQPPCGVTDAGAVNLQVSPLEVVSDISWSNGDNGFGISGLSAGIYSYVVLTNNGCEYTGDVTIQNVPGVSAIAFTSAYTDTSMGSAELFVWGGVQPIVFILDGDTVANPITNLMSGEYTVQVVDVNGCEDTVNFYIPNYSTSGVFDPEIVPFVASLGQGEILVKMSSFEPVYSIEVYDITGSLVIDAQNWKYRTDSNSFSHPLPSIAPGIYRVLVTSETFQSSAALLLHQY